MKITILQNDPKAKKLILRVEFDERDEVYEHTVSAKTKMPSTYKNDFVVSNTQKQINSTACEFDNTLEPMYEEVQEYTDFFGEGFTQSEASIRKYLEIKHNLIFTN